MTEKLPSYSVLMSVYFKEKKRLVNSKHRKYAKSNCIDR